MFIYQNLYQKMKNGDWKGAILPTPFYSNLYMPFNEADNLEFTDVALNHLILQREDVSIYSTPEDIIPIRREPANIHPWSISYRNEYTEFNGDMNGNTEGGDLSFGGEAIEAVVLRRSSSRSKFHIWEDIAIIPVTTTSLYTLDKIIYDPYVEHGITYQYAIQPVGSIGRGTQFETLKNMAVYDDIWLVGSDVKQLMCGFNPVVSNYKYVVKDTAIETIGSKYPYVIRNANVGYTQFNFSCTITAHMNIINDKETFTPFVDIEVLDEYKDIIISESGGSTGGGSTEVPDRPQPKPPKTLDINGDTRIRTNERAEDSTNKTVYISSVSEGPFTIMEDELPGGVIKIEFPIAKIQTQGLVDLEQMAKDNGTYDMYRKWVDGYDITIFVDDPDNPGQTKPVVERIPGNDWVPMFVDKIDTQLFDNEFADDLNLQKEISSFKFESTTRADEVVAAGVRNIKKKAYEARVASSGRAFDPAYPSSPETARALEQNATVVTSDKEFMLEREFRRRVMEFLHDGLPKIFKSPTEGLLLVKLSDINLTPNTTLGRMIYDFSCTCTEIGKVNPESLAKYGFREAIGDLLITKGNEFETEMNEQEAKQLYELFRT